ncbi:MAG: protein-L-isoaspartate(D-aspartate) O-methyltransferase [Saprospiraceae bacterium]
MTDTYRTKGLRQQLVKELQKKGISDQKILKAFEDIPRHYFLEKAFEDWAYKDVPFPIDSEQTISQPYTVAYQTQLLDVKKGDRILEIGTGSGFQACVLAYMGAKVYSIERHEKLYIKTTKLLEKIGYSMVRTLFGDGYLGAERYAPYQKILITAAAKEVPNALFEQLQIGGILIVPLGEDNLQVMTKFTKISNQEFRRESFDTFRFVPFLPGTEKNGAINERKPSKVENTNKVYL